MLMYCQCCFLNDMDGHEGSEIDIYTKNHTSLQRYLKDRKLYPCHSLLHTWPQRKHKKQKQSSHGEAFATFSDHGFRHLLAKRKGLSIESWRRERGKLSAILRWWAFHPSRPKSSLDIPCRLICNSGGGGRSSGRGKELVDDSSWTLESPNLNKLSSPPSPFPLLSPWWQGVNMCVNYL